MPMISHSDRARAYVSRHIGDASLPGLQTEVNDLKAEFKELLPKGSVAVDREMLRKGLEATSHSSDGAIDGSWCRFDGCDWDIDDDPPHSPDCPLGGDDVK